MKNWKIEKSKNRIMTYWKLLKNVDNSKWSNFNALFTHKLKFWKSNYLTNKKLIRQSVTNPLFCSYSQPYYEVNEPKESENKYVPIYNQIKISPPLKCDCRREIKVLVATMTDCCVDRYQTHWTELRKNKKNKIYKCKWTAIGPIYFGWKLYFNCQ